MLVTINCSVCQKSHEEVSLEKPEAEIVINPGMYNDGYVGTVHTLPCLHVAVVTKITKGGYETAGTLLDCYENFDQAQQRAQEHLYVFMTAPVGDPANYIGEKI